MTASSLIKWGAVIVAAGRSERFGDTDKLLHELDGLPVIGWSVRAMLSDPRIRQVAIAASPDNAAVIQRIVCRRFPSRPIVVCAGGASRSRSVRAGLDALEGDISFVAIHDGARPLVTEELVSSVLDAAEQKGAAVPVIQPTSSVCAIDSDGSAMVQPLDRSRLRELQTPQAARRSALIDALHRFPNETDESAALFRAGHDVVLIDGDDCNIKITRPRDLAIASVLCQDVMG